MAASRDRMALSRRRRLPTTPRTAWHPVFVVASESSVDLRVREVLAEFQLGKEPRRADEADRDLYNRMYRCIEQLSHYPEGAMAKDTDLVAKRWERDVAKMLPRMDPAVVLAGLAPEQRLAGLTTEEALCAMPLEALRALPKDYLRTLSPKTRARIRKRLGA